MADECEVTWPVEEIPVSDYLYMRIHEAWMKDGAPIPGSFRNRGRGMSTDWAKYSTAQQCKERAAAPEKNRIIKMCAGDILRIPGQGIEHSPKPDNRAHTDVTGEKDPEARLKFMRIYEWVQC